MKNEEKDIIFDRLLSINFELDGKVIPDPAYIGRKIGECHIYLDEVEKFFIKISREMSLSQRAVNNAQAKYACDKEHLLTTNDSIKSLPSIKDREAMANSYLKDDIRFIQEYENELSDLNNLLKAVTHKHRNLVRANNDIKSYVKMIEAQIKMGVPNANDSVAKNFMEEMNRGISGEDSFKNSISSVKENSVLDQTNLVDSLLNPEIIKSTETPAVSPTITVLEETKGPIELVNAPVEEKSIEDITEQTPEELEDEQEEEISEDPEWHTGISEDVISEVEKEQLKSPIVDLNSILSDIEEPPITKDSILKDLEKTGGENKKEDWLIALQEASKPCDPIKELPLDISTGLLPVEPCAGRELKQTKNLDNTLDLDEFLKTIS